MMSSSSSSPTRATSQRAPLRVCIIGAGTVGLSQALRLKEHEIENETVRGRSLDITIIAEKLLEDTTSYGSGGLWEPYQILGTPDDQVNEWGRAAYSHFLSLLHGPDAAKAGVQLLTAYNLLQAHDAPTEPSWKDIVFNFRQLTAQDIAQMGLPQKFTHGFTFATLVVEQSYYMRYLTEKLESWGVRFVQQRIDNLDEFIETGVADRQSYDVIFNCTGLGAAELLNTPGDTYPIRGQVLRVKAPWMNNVFFWGTSYIIPNVDTVVLGGTAQRDNYDTNPSESDTKKILDDVYELFPSMRDAEIVSVWAGLRPGRTPLRIESESRGGRLVIHNYGHGGSGITLAYGCANDTLQNHFLPRLSEFELTATEWENQAAGNTPRYNLRDWVRHKSRL